MTGPHPTNSSPDWDKIGRFLAGESSADETADVRRWLEQHPADARLVAALDAVAGTEAPVDAEEALRRVKTRIRATTPATPWSRYAGLAAAAAVVLAAGLWMSRRPESRRARATEHTYSTVTGERKEVLLTDGTQVMLGPATTLVVRGRQATVRGEAFFSVVHDERRPFVVRAGNAVIRDIGTDFTVHSDDGEAVRVVVNAGIVQMTYASDSVVLSRGDVGTLEAGGRVRALRGAATDDDLAWTVGRLVFRDASIAELAADLRRWYGVELRVTDSTLLRRHFTGSFGPETSSRVLDVIALAFGARVERRGDTAYIRTAPPAK